MHEIQAIHINGTGVNSVKLFKRAKSSDSKRTPTEYLRVPRFVLMQYTGLRDKNGVEIYEGDVVYYEDEQNIGDIYYSETAASFKIRFKPRNRQKFIPANLDTTFSIESRVMGNIYENPEIVGGEK